MTRQKRGPNAKIAHIAPDLDKSYGDDSGPAATVEENKDGKQAIIAEEKEAAGKGKDTEQASITSKKTREPTPKPTSEPTHEPTPLPTPPPQEPVQTSAAVKPPPIRCIPDGDDEIHTEIYSDDWNDDRYDRCKRWEKKHGMTITEYWDMKRIF